MMREHWQAGICIFFLVAVAACGGASSPPAMPEYPTGTADYETWKYDSATVPVGRFVTAAEIAESVRAAQGDVTILHVFGSWCPPCRFEFPELVRVAHRYRPLDVKVIAVAVDDTDTGLLMLLGGKSLPFEPLRIDFTTRDDVFRFVGELANVEAVYTGRYPYTAVYGRNGRKAFDWTDIRSEREYEQVIQTLL